MKIIIYLILAVLFISCNKKQRNTSISNLYHQDIRNDRFLSDAVLGNGNDILKIKLWQDNRKIYVKSAGISTCFLNNTIGSGNFSFCGNDYFAQVNGKFMLYDNDKSILLLIQEKIKDLKNINMEKKLIIPFPKKEIPLY